MNIYMYELDGVFIYVVTSIGVDLGKLPIVVVDNANAEDIYKAIAGYNKENYPDNPINIDYRW